MTGNELAIILRGFQISKGELASAMGVHINTVRRWVRSDNVPWRVFESASFHNTILHALEDAHDA